jgi:hypothetical protein
MEIIGPVESEETFGLSVASQMEYKRDELLLTVKYFHSDSVLPSKWFCKSIREMQHFYHESNVPIFP